MGSEKGDVVLRSIKVEIGIDNCPPRWVELFIGGTLERKLTLLLYAQYQGMEINFLDCSTSKGYSERVAPETSPNRVGPAL